MLGDEEGCVASCTQIRYRVYIIVKILELRFLGHLKYGLSFRPSNGISVSGVELIWIQSDRCHGVYSAGDDWIIILAVGASPCLFFFSSALLVKFHKTSNIVTIVGSGRAYLLSTDTSDTPWTTQHIRTRPRLVALMSTTTT